VTGLAALPTIETEHMDIASNTTNTQEMNATTMAPVVHALHPSGETPRSDCYCSQAVWNCKIRMMSCVSFFNTFLAESKELSVFFTLLAVRTRSMDNIWRQVGGS
jgi:hypothetical protein